MSSDVNAVHLYAEDKDMFAGIVRLWLCSYLGYSYSPGAEVTQLVSRHLVNGNVVQYINLPSAKMTLQQWPDNSWWRGVVGSAFRLKRSYSTPGLVSTVMGGCLRAGKPSQCEACQLGRLSLLPTVGR